MLETAPGDVPSGHGAVSKEIPMRRRVQEVMTTNVATVGEGAPFKQIVRILAEWRISALPVLDAAGRVVGIVSEADLLHKEEFPEGPGGRDRSKPAAGARRGPRRPATRRPS